MVLLLSVIVLSCKVRPCQFVRHCPVLQCLVLHFQKYLHPIRTYSTTTIDWWLSSVANLVDNWNINHSPRDQLTFVAHVRSMTTSRYVVGHVGHSVWPRDYIGRRPYGLWCGHPTSLYQIWCKYLHPLWRHEHFTIFNMAAIRHLGFVRGSQETTHEGPLSLIVSLQVRHLLWYYLPAVFFLQNFFYSEGAKGGGVKFFWICIWKWWVLVHLSGILAGVCSYKRVKRWTEKR